MKNQTDEKYIIELIREGKANKEIAAITYKSLGTIKQIVSRLMKKYDCKNRVQLALKDVSQGTN